MANNVADKAAIFIAVSWAWILSDNKCEVVTDAASVRQPWLDGIGRRFACLANLDRETLLFYASCPRKYCTHTEGSRLGS